MAETLNERWPECEWRTGTPEIRNEFCLTTKRSMFLLIKNCYFVRSWAEIPLTNRVPNSTRAVPANCKIDTDSPRKR